MHNGLKIIVILFFSIIQMPFAFSQVEKSNLIPLLSAADQKKIEKIDGTLKKGESIQKESEDIKNSATNEKEIYKNEKKYSLKRLEAAQYFQKANNDMINLLKDNIAAFWKKNKPDQIKSGIKNNEDKASELSRKARSLRYVAEDLIYPEEKLEKITEAEEVEKEAIAIYTKVLYAYLNQPVEYNVIVNSNVKEDIGSQSSSVEAVSTESKREPEKSSIQYIPVSSSIEDSAQTPIIENTQVSVTAKENSLAQQKTEISEPKNVQTDSTSIYNLVDVNEEQIDKFNKYLKDSFPENYEHYVIDFKNLKYNDIDSLKESWRRYLYSPQYAYETKPVNTKPALEDTSRLFSDNNSVKNTTNPQRSQMDDKLKTKTKEKSVATDKKTNQKATIGADKPKDPEIAQAEKRTTSEKTNNKEQNKTKPVENASPVTSEISNSYSSETDIAEGFVYRVQILACRIPIDSQSLKHIYNGELNIMELNEDNWFKYAIGEFNTYRDANQLKNRIKVPGAFIIAYLNGKRIQILNTQNYSQNNSTSETGLITYKVQISASKKQLNETYLRNIYSGNFNIEETLEDEWYKYSIVFGPSLNKALEFIQNEDIPGAFITSYKNNKKIELKEALRISKSK